MKLLVACSGRDRHAQGLAIRLPAAKSWWDVGALFPILFVDFDRRHLKAFYHTGIPLDRDALDGWTSEFVDFAAEFDESRIPNAEEFWVQDGTDWLTTTFNN